MNGWSKSRYFQEYWEESRRRGWEGGNIWVKFGSPHYQSSSKCFWAIEGKVRVAGLLAVQKEGVLAEEGFGEESKVALKCLGFTEEDEIRLVFITKIFNIHKVPAKSFHVPGKAFEFIIINNRSFGVWIQFVGLN